MSTGRNVKSVLRALDALELVASSRRGLSVFEISRGLGVSRPAAYHVAETLTQRQYLLKTGSPARYRLGSVMRQLGLRQARWNRDVLGIATVAAIRLSRRLCALVRVCRYVAGEVVVRVRVPGGEGDPPDCPYPRPIDAYGSAAICQAFMTDSQLREYRTKHPLSKSADSQYWKSLTNVDAVLDLVREEGYLAFVKSGVFRAAAVIYGPDGQVVAIITVVDRFCQMATGEPWRYVEALRQAAKNLTVSLRNPSAASRSR